MLSPVETEETLGEAEVRALFRVSRLGTIAGCMVTSRRRAAVERSVRVVRDGTVIYETSISQLKRFKDQTRLSSESRLVDDRAVAHHPYAALHGAPAPPEVTMQPAMVPRRDAGNSAAWLLHSEGLLGLDR